MKTMECLMRKATLWKNFFLDDRENIISHIKTKGISYNDTTVIVYNLKVYYFSGFFSD